MTKKRKRHPQPEVGDQYGEWTVIGESRMIQQKKGKRVRVRHFPCRCSCGATSLVPSGNLVHGLSTRCQDCGFKAAAKSNAVYPHGSRGTRKRLIWQNRIIDDRDETWSTYEQYAKDIGDPPKPPLTIVKIDESKPYGRDNWRIGNRRIDGAQTYQDRNGDLWTVAMLAEHLGLSRQRIDQRLKRGDTVDQILGREPLNNRPGNRKYKWENGEYATGKQIADLSGISMSKVYELLQRGRTPDEIVRGGKDLFKHGNNKHRRRDGTWMTGQQISAETGYSISKVFYWLRKGMSVEDILSGKCDNSSKGPEPKQKLPDGRVVSKRELAKMCGVSLSRITYLRNKGMTPGQILKEYKKRNEQAGN